MTSGRCKLGIMRGEVRVTIVGDFEVIEVKSHLAFMRE
jgi:hypothetical protein